MSSCLKTPAHTAWSYFGGAIFARLPVAALSMFLLGAVLVSGCSESLSKEYPVRYRIAVSVETKERTYTNSGVYQVTYRLAKRDDHYRVVNALTKGEAIPLDLGTRGLVFVLITSTEEFAPTEPTGIGPSLFFRKALSGLSAPDLESLQKDTLREVIPQELIPMIVTFKDLSNRDSLVRVRPQAPADALGDGVVSISATIETTGDAVTEGLAATLPWIIPPTDHPKDQGRIVMPSADVPIIKMTRPPTAVENLRIYDFRKGFR